MNTVHLEARRHKCGTHEKSLKHPFDIFIPKSKYGRKKLRSVRNYCFI